MNIGGFLMNIKIVKTWSESIKEGKAYLQYNNYGKVIHIPNTDLYICFGCKECVELKDVKVLV